MLRAWAQRNEPLGVLVVTAPLTVHSTIGDEVHRIAVRDPQSTVVVLGALSTPWRSIVPLLLLGRRVAVCVQDEDDVQRVAVRLCAHGPHLRDIETAVWNGVVWHSASLASLL